MPHKRECGFLPLSDPRTFTATAPRSGSRPPDSLAAPSDWIWSLHLIILSLPYTDHVTCIRQNCKAYLCSSLVSLNQTELSSTVIAGQSLSSVSHDEDDEDAGRVGGGHSGGGESDSNGGESGDGGPVATGDDTVGR